MATSGYTKSPTPGRGDGWNGAAYSDAASARPRPRTARCRAMEPENICEQTGQYSRHGQAAPTTVSIWPSPPRRNRAATPMGSDFRFAAVLEFYEPGAEAQARADFLSFLGEDLVISQPTQKSGDGQPVFWDPLGGPSQDFLRVVGNPQDLAVWPTEAGDHVSV